MATAAPSDSMRIPASTPSAVSAETIVSVAIFPDQRVSRKRAAAESGQRAIKSPATRLVRRQNFFRGLRGMAVQMHADLDPGHACFTALYNSPTCSGVALPTVSARETVRTPISFSHTKASSTISGPHGSS